MKKIRIITVTLLITLILNACGSNGTAYDYKNEAATDSYSGEGIYSDYEAAEMSLEDSYEEVDTPSENVEIDEDAVDNRKLIKTVNIDVETMDFDSVYSSIENKVKSMGGYISDSNIWTNGTDLKNCSMTIRIPAEKIDSLISIVEEGTNVIRKNESVEDVTMRFTDLEAHKKALLTEQDSLMRLMEQAETMADIIEIQRSLTDVRYQIESMESQLRILSNQISYSTINLSIEEVSQPTPTKEETVWEMIARRFKNRLSDVTEFLIDFVIGLIVNIPVIIALLIVLIVVMFIIKIFIKVINTIFKKNKKHKKEKKNDEHERHDEGDVSMESVQRESP